MYIGNTPTTQSFISGTDYFNGTGSQTAFTLTRTVNSQNDVEAVVNNVVQQPNDAYTISGTTITFTSAPSAGTNNVYVRYLSTTTQTIAPSQNSVGFNQLSTDVQQDLGISFKNRIINGAMVIDQRNAGASIGTGYAVDRFVADNGTDSVYTQQQVSDAPAGFNYSVKITVTTADASIGAGQFSSFFQAIEGYNIADLGWGTANAKTVTLSFWVKSSLTGTFGGSLRGASNTRSFPYTYTISSANTWEYKTVTITGDTTGAWNATNGTGVQVLLNLGTGSTFSGTAGAWANASYRNATGTTNLVSTLNATWQITGVQLEVGTQATAFSTAGGSYGAELALCQRYFQRYNATVGTALSTANLYNSTFSYKVTMRAAPTLESGGTFTVSSGSAGTPAIFIGTGAPASPDAQWFYNSSINWTVNSNVQFTGGFTAEL